MIFAEISIYDSLKNFKLDISSDYYENNEQYYFDLCYDEHYELVIFEFNDTLYNQKDKSGKTANGYQYIRRDYFIKDYVYPCVSVAAVYDDKTNKVANLEYIVINPKFQTQSFILQQMLNSIKFR